ncbi:transposase [Streptomyces sp. NPDC085529]|uniref:transposase n=1 Tax=Streptomyces sp. NPDC085529 TaxID=3365729 RepID=UPI0037D0B3D4
MPRTLSLREDIDPSCVSLGTSSFTGCVLPACTPKRGGRWRDHRQVIGAIAFKYRTGTPWMDLPQHSGAWKGAHNQLRKWAGTGTWERVFTGLALSTNAGVLEQILGNKHGVLRDAASW